MTKEYEWVINVKDIKLHDVYKKYYKRTGQYFSDGLERNSDLLEQSMSKTLNEGENMLANEFVKGLIDNPELKKKWEETATEHVRSELEDLLAVYEKAMVTLEKKYDITMMHAIEFMKDFIKATEEKKEMQKKIDKLVSKLEPKSKVEKVCI